MWLDDVGLYMQLIVVLLLNPLLVYLLHFLHGRLAVWAALIIFLDFLLRSFTEYIITYLPGQLLQLLLDVVYISWSLKLLGIPNN